MQPNQRFALHAVQPRQAEGLPEGLLEVPEFDPGLLRRHRIRVRRLIRRIKAGYGDPQDEPCTGLDHAAQPHQPEETNMSYQDRDKHGMYKGEGAAPGPLMRHGPGPGLMGADTLMGNDVFNKDGEDLGDIQEIMLDMRNGKVSYAVMSFGGFLGIGDKLFAVPWNALTLDTENKRFTLDVAKERLEGAPGFDQNCWPDMADQSWAQQIHDYYGTRPYSDDSKL